MFRGEAEPRGWARTKVLLHLVRYYRVKKSPSATFPDFHANIATETLGLCCALWLLSGSHWPQAQGSTAWEISDLQWFGNEIKAGSLENGTSAELSLRLAWCLCTTPSHNYLPCLVSQVVWNLINRMCFLNITKHLKCTHHLYFIHFRQNPSRNSQYLEPQKRLLPKASLPANEEKWKRGSSFSRELHHGLTNFGYLMLSDSFRF